MEDKVRILLVVMFFMVIVSVTALTGISVLFYHDIKQSVNCTCVEVGK